MYHSCIKEDEMGGVCGRHGDERKYLQRLWWEKPKKRDHFDEL